MVQKYLSATLFSALAFFTSGFAFAGDDLGDLDKDKAAKVFSGQANLFALCGPQFPDAAVLRRHASAHRASFDAGAFGARLGPRDAYRFARGEEVMASTAASRSSSRARSISSSSRITRTTWACSPTCSPASPNCSPIRRAASGTT